MNNVTELFAELYATLVSVTAFNILLGLLWTRLMVVEYT